MVEGADTVMAVDGMTLQTPRAIRFDAIVVSERAAGTKHLTEEFICLAFDDFK